jgi:hypothetical protein
MAVVDGRTKIQSKPGTAIFNCRQTLYSDSPKPVNMNTDLYLQLRSLLHLGPEQALYILPDNARTHISSSQQSRPSETSRRRKSWRCKKRRSKSPPSRWEAVKEYAPSMPPPRSPVRPEKLSIAAAMPLRKPVRCNSFDGTCEDLMAMSQTMHERSFASLRLDKISPPVPPCRLLVDSTLFHSNDYSFQSPASSMEEIWQLLDDLSDKSTEDFPEDMESQSNGIMQTS